MKTKPIVCPERLRYVPRQFSWIDQRLVRDRHIQGRSPEALALYLMLCTVADAQGASYYSEASAGRLLSLCSSALRAARRELVVAGLIAYRAPFYQVLSLEPAPGAAAAGLPAPTPVALSARPAPEARPLEARPLEAQPLEAQPLEVPEPRIGEGRSIGEILRAMLAQTSEEQAP